MLTLNWFLGSLEIDSVVRSLRAALDYIDSPYAQECIARRDAEIAVLTALRELLRTEHEAGVVAGLTEPDGARAEELMCSLVVINEKIEDAERERRQMISGKPCSSRSVLG